MKRVLYLTSLLLLAVGCSGSGAGEYTIKAKFASADGTTSVRLVEGLGSLDKVADLKSVDRSGVVDFQGEVDTPYIMRVMVDGSAAEDRYRGVLFVERGEITIDGSQSGNVVAKGTPINNRFNKLLEDFEAEAMAGEDLSMAERVERFEKMVYDKIDENLDNPIGLFLLREVVIPNMSPSGEQVIEILERFTPEMQEGRDGVEIREYLHEMAAIDIGASYINFTLPDAEGENISLESLIGDGKWVLVYFWATWCGPCMSEMPYLKEAYERFHPLGFEICGVSVDADHDKWREFSQAKLPWVSLSAGDSDVMMKYKVSGIPANFLISPQGKIVAKGLRGNDIAIELEKHLKK